jgi:GAF domain-containing protein
MTNRTNAVSQSFDARLDAARAQGLRALNLAMMIAGSIFTVTLFAQYGSDPVGRISPFGMAGMAVTGLLALISLRRQRLRLAGTISVYGILISLFFFFLPFGVNHVGVVVFTFPLVVAVGTFKGRNGVLGVALATLVSGLIIHYVDFFKLIDTITFIPPNQLNTGPMFTLLAGVIAYTGMLFATLRRQQNSLAQVIAEARNLESVAGLSTLLSDPDSLKGLLTEAVDALRDRLGYYYAQVFMFEPQSNLLTRQAMTRIGRGNVPDHRIGLSDAENMIARVARTGTIQQVGFDAPDAERIEFLPATRTEIVLPLRRGGVFIGVLDVHSTQTTPLSEFQLVVLEAFAAQLSVAALAFMRDAELQEASTDRRRLQDQNNRLTREVDRLTQEVTDRAWTRYLANRPGGVVGYNWHEGEIAQATEISASLRDTYENAMPAVTSEGVEQVLGVPILSRGRVIGVMEFRAPAETPWDSRSLELARTVAQRLSLTLDNIRLFEQAQINASREYTINQVAARLQSKIDLDALLRDATDAFNQAVGGTRTRIKLITPDQVEQFDQAGDDA